MPQKHQRPTAIFSVCAPTDLQWLERWEAHLCPLEQADIISVWSVRHLQPGTDRPTLLHDHLDHADLIVLLLSADFFTDDECVALMERALACHQQGTVRLIPLLLRPVAFRETKLATLALLPSNGSPITQWQDPEAAFDDCVRELRRILGRPVTQPLTGRLKLLSVKEQNRARMLQRLRRTYEELFTQSLQGVAQIELELADRPDAVQNAATLLFQSATRPERLLPPGTSILDVYDEATYELLILGTPGAGKSTLLVELAQQLVGRAEANETHPLPVILPLSSWAVKRPSLDIWLVEQVAQIYNIPEELAIFWSIEDPLLLLLDGLDEMEEAARPACIAAINDYHRNHLRIPLVVCSRQAEYEEASKSQRLALQNAVVVQPLTHKHVQVYLGQAGKTLSALRGVLSANSTLAEVATTPLMVHILSLTYQGTSVQPLSTQREQLQQQVWTDYVQHMVERKRDVLHYSFHKGIPWLGQLARKMRDHNQTVFYFEQLQPDWLPKSRRGLYQWSAGLLSGLVAGLICDLAFGLIFGWIVGLILGLVVGLVFGLIFGLKGQIKPAEELTWSWENWISSLFGWLISGLIFGLPIGLLSWLIGGPRDGLISGLLGALIGGLLGELSRNLVCGIRMIELTERHTHTPNEGTRRSVKNGLYAGLIFGSIVVLLGLVIKLLVWLTLGLTIGLTLELAVALTSGLAVGLTSGLGAAIQHYTLRFWLWPSHRFPWKAQQFLDDAVTCILLRRVGGGYSFVHRLLLDHLADATEQSTEQMSTSMATRTGSSPL